MSTKKTKTKAARYTEIPISKIVVSKKRHRKEMGDIPELAADIATIDMLEPIVVRPIDGGRYELACGARRVRAAEKNGQTHIAAIVRPLTDAEMVRAEFSENTHRKNFTLSEAVAIKRRLEPLEKVAAKERQREGGRAGGKASGKLPQASKGSAADKAVKATGRARRTLEKAEAIVDAAKAEPERFGKLKEDMDRTGRVDGPFKRLKVMRQAEAIRAESPPYPNQGPYRGIVADVPWPYEVRKEDPSHRATHPYPQMSIEQICAEGDKVRAIAHEDCILWFWTTNHHMREAFTVLDAWGFEAKTILTWVKDKIGYGDWLRGQTEHCILATRGKPIVELTNQSTVLYGPMRANSQKPDEFLEFVETLCPAPRYAYLFARNFKRDLWDGHGDEALPAVDAEALADVLKQVPRVRAENDAAECAEDVREAG